jgi:hypothetical protein
MNIFTKIKNIFSASKPPVTEEKEESKPDNITLALIALYDRDKINIDFENVNPKDSFILKGKFPEKEEIVLHYIHNWNNDTYVCYTKYGKIDAEQTEFLWDARDAAAYRRRELFILALEKMAENI